MRTDFPSAKPRQYRTRRSIGDRVREALLKLAQGEAQLLSHQEKSWASITFAGTRHELTLRFEGTVAIEAGENFIAALPDHEFAIPGQLVAEATITAASHGLLPEPSLEVSATLLLLEEA